MKVYHGSTQAVEYPLVGVGRENLDFGKGFYVTDIYAQAERWGAVMALRHPGSTSVVNIYELDVEKINSSGYKWLHFDGYNNDWLEFIVSSRLGKQPWLEYDIVEGGIANDRVFDTIENFMENQITKEVALGRLRFEQPNNQLCILNQRLIVWNKYTRVVMQLAERLNISPEKALHLFYNSKVYALLLNKQYPLITLSDAYITDEIILELQQQ